jgi:hypothetical protein
MNGITKHFEGKSANVRKTYDKLLKGVRRFGEVQEEPKKTSIHLVNSTAFAGVATRKDSITLTIKANEPLKSPRIHRSEQASAHRYHHELKLNSPSDVDAELMQWLQNAYRLSA